MRGSFHAVENAVHAGLAEGVRVGAILGVEQIGCSGTDPGRWQAGAVCGVVPDLVPQRVEIPVRRGSVVEHGTEQPLRGGLATAFVGEALDEAGCDSGARTLTADRDTARVDPAWCGVGE